MALNLLMYENEAGTLFEKLDVFETDNHDFFVVRYMISIR